MLLYLDTEKDGLAQHYASCRLAKSVEAYSQPRPGVPNASSMAELRLKIEGVDEELMLARPMTCARAFSAQCRVAATTALLHLVGLAHSSRFSCSARLGVWLLVILCTPHLHMRDTIETECVVKARACGCCCSGDSRIGTAPLDFMPMHATSFDNVFAITRTGPRKMSYSHVQPTSRTFLG